MRAKATPLAFMLGRITTPIGTLLVVTDREQRLRAVDFDDYEDRMHALMRTQYRQSGSVALADAKVPTSISTAIEAYFGGDLTAIDDLQVATGGTDFQRKTWRALRSIPPGKTTTYGKLASKIGSPATVRAVGMANGANPIGIVVPCHRVIGADASLTGYGGGLPRKHWLLTHEGARFKSSVQDMAARLPGL